LPYARGLCMNEILDKSKVKLLLENCELI
jgi:hypothetical protein